MDAEETSTVFLNKFHSPALRALRTNRTTEMERAINENVFGKFGDAQSLYFGGDMEAAVPLSGQVAGRIDAVRPVTEIIEETAREFFEAIEKLSSDYAS